MTETIEIPQPKCLGGFKLIMTDHPTQVHFHKFDDGCVRIILETAQEHGDPLSTILHLTPATFQMLSNGLFSIAHDPNILHPLEAPIKKKRAAKGKSGTAKP